MMPSPLVKSSEPNVLVRSCTSPKDAQKTSTLGARTTGVSSSVNGGGAVSLVARVELVVLMPYGRVSPLTATSVVEADSSPSLEDEHPTAATRSSATSAPIDRFMTIARRSLPDDPVPGD